MKKNKHDHKGTKILKLGIFSTLMLAPFMAVTFKCAYVTFNKNAKDSYTSENVTNLRTISNNNQMIENLNYVISYKELNNGVLNTQDLEYSYLSFNPNDYGWNGNYSKIRLYSNGTIGMYNIDTQALDFIANIWGQQIKSFTITWLSGGWNNGGNAVFNQIIETPSKLDNAFYYAIEEAIESPYFAWARTSALYTATSALTTGMGINTQAVPTLIVYWLVLTLIYIVLDIVIELFTFLTHNFMQKTE